MSRSLRVAPQMLERVKQALAPAGFSSQIALAEEVGLGQSTIKSFLNGRPVDRLNFIEIATRLNLDWNEIKTSLNSTPDRLDLDSSPFITGSPIEHPKNFYGREAELKRLFRLFKWQPLQNGVIIGPKRSGKTSLLYYLSRITTTPPDQLRPGQKQDWLPQPERYRWIYVDFQDPRLHRREGIMGYLLRGLGLPVPESCDLVRFMEVVTDHLSGPTVILMDEVGSAIHHGVDLDDPFWESLRSLATTQTRGRMAFVLALGQDPMELAMGEGISSPFFNIFGCRVNLGPLAEAEARELINRSPIPFSEADVVWILEQSRGWPLLIQILCSEYLFHLEEGLEYRRDNGLRQIIPFKKILQEK